MEKEIGSVTGLTVVLASLGYLTATNEWMARQR